MARVRLHLTYDVEVAGKTTAELQANLTFGLQLGWGQTEETLEPTELSLEYYEVESLEV